MPPKRLLNAAACRLNSQRGAALVLAVMMLAVLTLFGISATTTGMVEIDIARNEKFHDMAFYRAESGWRYAVSWIDLHPDGVVEEYGSVAAPGSFAEAFSRAATAQPENVGGEKFAVDIAYTGGGYAALWDSDYRRFRYAVTADGFGPGGARSRIEAHPGKIFHTGGY